MFTSLHLTLDPRHKQADNPSLLVIYQRTTLRNTMPFFQAAATTTGASVHGFECWMPLHRGLFAVVFGMGRRKAASYEIVRVTANDIEPFFAHIANIANVQLEAVSEFRPR